VVAPALRYLSASDVITAMPPLEERLRLAEQTLVALADGSAELPPKIGVHPRSPTSFGHAMPAALRGDDREGADDLLGLKWVVGHPANGARGLPTIHATVVLNDPATGLPLAILDGGPITAARTAAVSGVAIRRFAPASGSGGDGARRVAILGAGVQGHSHLAVVGHLLPGASLAVFDRHPERAEALAEEARATDGIAEALGAPTARAAVDGADVVISAVSFGPIRQVMTNEWLAPEALVIPVDYATTCAAEVARDASLFVVDEVGQFLANRDAGLFDGYPDPTTTLGAAILDDVGRPGSGRVVVTHLGTGLADLILGAAIVRTAAAEGLGSILPR
jgi:ornithine cyclodeaminase/alanine dehydrogenase-like protein (mu-crystallin family)